MRGGRSVPVLMIRVMLRRSSNVLAVTQAALFSEETQTGAGNAQGSEANGLALDTASVLLLSNDRIDVFGTSSSGLVLAGVAVEPVGLVVAALELDQTFEAHDRPLCCSLCFGQSQTTREDQWLRTINVYSWCLRPSLGGGRAVLTAQLPRLVAGFTEAVCRAGRGLVHTLRLRILDVDTIH